MPRKRTAPAPAPDDYDTPWKDALVVFFERFMAFYFPEAHAQIDWSQPEVFLDTELSEIAPDAVVGKLFVDKLVQVHLQGGGVDWICVHIEVQGQEQARFAERMYVYSSRIFHRFGRPVASMAVLADANPAWRPSQFSYNVLGCKQSLEFLTAKLTDFEPDLDALPDNPNPFALLTAAHLLTQRTKHDDPARLATKIRLVRLLYRHEWDEKRIISLFRVIDWMMRLPEEFERTFQTELRTLKEERKMQYVTSVERLAAQDARKEALKEGLKEGRQEASIDLLSRVLTLRFGPLPSTVATRIGKASVRQLGNWVERAISAATLDDVFRKTAS